MDRNINKHVVEPLAQGGNFYGQRNCFLPNIFTIKTFSPLKSSNWLVFAIEQKIIFCEVPFNLRA